MRGSAPCVGSEVLLGLKGADLAGEDGGEGDVEMICSLSQSVALSELQHTLDAVLPWYLWLLLNLWLWTLTALTALTAAPP